MIIERGEGTIIVKDCGGDCNLLLRELEAKQNEFTDHNLIIDISLGTDVSLDFIKKFAPLSKFHKKNNKSFVIVAQNIDYNKVPLSLLVVPTVLEAQDIIGLEEIERDLMIN